MAHGVNFRARLTNQGFPITENKKCAFFKSEFFLYSNAYSVLSKEMVVLVDIKNNDARS
jgi:hypothetical protein